jgi:hypothetical protein
MLLSNHNQEGCSLRAEIIPFKPDPGNAGVGKADIKKALFFEEGLIFIIADGWRSPIQSGG